MFSFTFQKKKDKTKRLCVELFWEFGFWQNQFHLADSCHVPQQCLVKSVRMQCFSEPTLDCKHGWPPLTSVG